jgi:lactoylglutathione lyase
MSKTATDGRRAAPSCPETAIEGVSHAHQAGAVVITGVSKVVVPVDDQERAIEFWTERMGFELRRDEAYDGGRWIEVSPPSGGPLLILSPRPPGEPEPAVPDELPHSPVFFACADIEATYRELSERGVVFPVPPRRQDFGWWSLFEDPDGTRYALSHWA